MRKAGTHIMIGKQHWPSELCVMWDLFKENQTLRSPQSQSNRSRVVMHNRRLLYAFCNFTVHRKRQQLVYAF